MWSAIQTGAPFDGASLVGVDFGGGIFDRISLFFATLRYARMRASPAPTFAARSSRTQQGRGRLRRGEPVGSVAGAIRPAPGELRADLSNADLADALLEGADFLGAVPTAGWAVARGHNGPARACAIVREPHCGRQCGACVSRPSVNFGQTVALEGRRRE
ncbi:MAG: pentapeptide repeat-containing protein [Bauldia sp.]|nr:pentapeptide repeat-containing protein [Bauldia sp.]